MGQKKWMGGAAYWGCFLAMVLFTGCVGFPRRLPIQYCSDTLTTQRVTDALKAAQLRPAIYVQTFDQVVSLSGVVNSAEEKERAVDTARRVKGVREVLDYLTLKETPET